MGRMIMPPGPADVFEQRLEAANKHSAETAWETALVQIEEAEDLIKKATFSSVAARDHAQLRLLIQRGTLERRLGNYKRAIDLLQHASQQFEKDNAGREHLETLGELGMALLRQDAFPQASDTFQQQYNLARFAAQTFEGRGGFRKALAYACHAVGNRALAVFQMAVSNLDEPEKIDKEQLSLAIELLKERIERATFIRTGLRENEKHSGIWNMTTAWHAEALDRLVLCCLALRDTAKAREYGRDSMAISQEQPESTVQGLSRFHYGLALYYGGRKDEALELWKQTGDGLGCTAAIALARESSNENTERLRLLAQHGIGFLRHDDHGYSVLDYTVLSGNERMKAVAIEGMRHELSQCERNGQYLAVPTIVARIEHSVIEAQRRKKYRETYQLTFRPILSKLTEDRGITNLSYQSVSRWTMARHWLRSSTFFPLGRSDEEVYISRHARRRDGIDKLRKGYLRQREMDEETRMMFDRLVVFHYQDFKKKMTRLPSPHDKDDMQEVVHLRQGYTPVPGDAKDDQPPFIIFLSYRWIGKGSPDDGQHTQYRRMVDALDSYLKMHPWLDQKQILVWLVSSPKIPTMSREQEFFDTRETRRLSDST
jgi:tetratricopeptide (TPR) repeat protein